MRPVPSLSAILDSQRGHLFPWAPVLYGTGIGVYFSLRFEPTTLHWISLGLVAGALVLGLYRANPTLRLILTAGLLILAGFSVVGLRAHTVSEPKLSFRYYGPVEGRVVNIDRSQSGALRLTLDSVILSRMSPNRTPNNVRISLHGTQTGIRPANKGEWRAPCLATCKQLPTTN